MDPIEKLKRRKEFEDRFGFYKGERDLTDYKDVDFFAIYDSTIRRG